MTALSHPFARLSRWRAARARRAADERALRAEFELERPRRFAAIREYAAQVQALEQARISSHAPPRRQPATPAAERLDRLS